MDQKLPYYMASWIRDLIQVMLYQEIYKRRSDQRKYNQKYYQGIAFPKG